MYSYVYPAPYPLSGTFSSFSLKAKRAEILANMILKGDISYRLLTNQNCHHCIHQFCLLDTETVTQ